METTSKYYFYLVAQYTYLDLNKKDNVERLGLVNGAVTGDNPYISRKEIEFFNINLMNKIVSRHANRKVLEFSLINIVPLGLQSLEEWNFDLEN